MAHQIRQFGPPRLTGDLHQANVQSLSGEARYSVRVRRQDIQPAYSARGHWPAVFFCAGRLLAVFCALVILTGIGEPGPGAARVAALTSQPASRTIHLVYDDSGSMLDAKDSGYARWTYANYAMSVFAAMLGPADTLNIYQMSLNKERLASASMTNCLTLHGSDPASDRVFQSANLARPQKDMNTPFNAVRNAYSDLRSADTGSSEKWLVILTDGQFTGFEDSQLIREIKILQEQAGGTIRIVYLAIGSTDVARIGDEDDPDLNSRGIYPYYAARATGSKGILSKVTKIGNNIFQNYELKAACQLTAAQTIQLNLEMPVDQLIVFAQGQQVELGELTASGCSYTATLASPQVKANPDLSGCIATYTDGGQLIPAGAYNVELKGHIADISNIRVYARPVVTLGVEFFDDRHNPVAADVSELIEGTYTYKIVLRDHAGQPIALTEQTRDIYKTIRPTILVNGQSQGTAREGQVSVETGTLEIRASATLPPSGKKIEANNGQGLQFTVVRQQPPRPLLTLWQDGQMVSGLEIAAGDYEYRLALQDPLIDQPAAAELQTRTELDLSISENGQRRTVENPGTSGRLTLKTGQAVFRVTATLDNGLRTTKEFPFTVIGQLQMVAEGTVACHLKDLETAGQTLLLRATFDGQPLTPEQLQAARISYQRDGIDWNLTPGSAISTWIATPRYRPGGLLATRGGDLDQTFVLELQTGGRPYQASAVSRLALEDLSFLERIGLIFRLYWWLIAAILLLIFLLLAYLLKKRFRPVKYQYKGLIQRGVIPQVELTFKKDTASVWQPFVAETATISGSIEARGNTYYFSIPVEAAGDEMKVRAYPTFMQNCTLATGITTFRQQPIRNGLQLLPNLAEDPVQFAYEDSIRLNAPVAGVTWTNQSGED